MNQKRSQIPGKTSAHIDYESKKNRNSDKQKNRHNSNIRVGLDGNDQKIQRVQLAENIQSAKQTLLEKPIRDQVDNTSQLKRHTNESGTLSRNTKQDEDHYICRKM